MAFLSAGLHISQVAADFPGFDIAPGFLQCIRAGAGNAGCIMIAADQAGDRLCAFRNRSGVQMIEVPGASPLRLRRRGREKERCKNGSQGPGKTRSPKADFNFSRPGERKSCHSKRPPKNRSTHLKLRIYSVSALSWLSGRWTKEGIGEPGTTFDGFLKCSRCHWG